MLIYQFCISVLSANTFYLPILRKSILRIRKLEINKTNVHSYLFGYF